ncbi:MAG: DNA-binding response regulator, partial [Candidatus Nealsonbacteria bacterium]
RIRSLLRRPNGMLPDRLELDDLILDTKAGRLTVSDKEIPLTTREYALLEYLLRNKDMIVSRENILDHVWDNFYDTLSNVVDVHLKNLRKKLPKKYAERIETIRGKGYRVA